jgi:ABC-type sugar transport system permease subunit
MNVSQILRPSKERQVSKNKVFKKPNSPIRVVVFFLAPALIIYLAFVMYPLLKVFRLCLFRWHGITRGTEEFIGFGNFIKLINDEIFWRSLANNLILFVFVIIVSVSVALFFSYILARKIRGSRFYRATWLFPNMLGDVIVATIWLFIYHPTIGMLNYFLKLIGIDIGAIPWLGQASTALIAVTMPMIWKFTGLYIILFLAAMQEIPQSFLDAARIDGANRWQEFYHVVLPLIRPTIAVAVVFLMWNSFSVIFTYVKLLTEGGPHRSTEVLPTYIYQVGFQYHEFGYGSAISVAAFILIFILAAFVLRMLMGRVVRGEKGF